MPLQPNQQLDEFRIISLLGQGGFGAVYLAEDTLLDRKVAIKELLVDRQRDELSFNRFLQEARTVGNLNHPNLVTVYALRVKDDRHYMIMEYVDGGSLRDLLKKRGKIEVEQALQIAIDVCNGLAVAHDKGIVHRDIKPENILLTKAGTAKVSDFGIAHVPRNSDDSAMTQYGFQPGTLVYMSPEQVLGKSIDARSDIYQIGELLYEMVFGRHYINLAEIEQRARRVAGNNVLHLQAKIFEFLANAVCIAPIDVSDASLLLPGLVLDAITSVMAKDILSRPADTKQLVPRLKELSTNYENDKRFRTTQAHVHVKLGNDLREKEESQGAAQEYLKAIQLDPNNIDAHLYLGVVYEEMKQTDDAIKEYHRALELDPKNAKVYLHLGSAYYDLKQIEAAIEEYQKALALDSKNVEFHFHLGVAYQHCKRFEDATRSFQTALRLDPTYAGAHVNLGSIFDEQGRTDDAIREYRAAINVDVERGAFAYLAHYNLGVLYRKQSKLDAAERELRAALDIFPAEGFASEVHVLLGKTLVDNGRTDEAITEYQSALQINPNDAAIRNNLGLLYLAKGLFDAAEPEFVTVMRLNSNLAEPHFNLGMIYERRNRLQEAISEYKAALRIRPDFTRAEVALRGIYRVM
jgi:serine/threonine protein kinase